MENIVVSRAVLIGLVVFHAFVGYGSRAVRGHIDRHFLNRLLIAELLAVTAYIVYDNICAPPAAGWFWAIVGYVFVYFIILATWFMYRPNAIMDKNAIYKFVACKPVEFLGKTYMHGYAEVRGNLEEVLLPYEEYEGVTHHMLVKFREVIEVYIIVTAA
ncbi:MAG: hypothetical protein J6Y53_05115 [Alphaproteobacteria bacterium]|nr:hypothetical protein [Alphaproteobacteria bacterium]